MAIRNNNFAIALRLAGALHSTNANSLTAGDFRIAFALVGVIAPVAVIDSFTLASNAGAVLSGHRLRHGPLPADGPRLRSPLSSRVMPRRLTQVLECNLDHPYIHRKIKMPGPQTTSVDREICPRRYTNV
jgi:hypothetical protein